MAKASKTLLKKKKTPKISHISVPLTVSVLLLLISLFFIIHEAKKNQDNRTRAQVVNCDVPAAEIALDDEEQKMLTLLNAYRQDNGVPALKNSTNLNKMAAWLSKDMAAKNYLEHDDSLGRDPDKRAQDCGSPYNAENIAMGDTSAQVTLDDWKTSPGHNENMLDPQLKFVGIARSGEYWTQDFSEEDTGNTEPPINPTATQAPDGPVPSPNCLGACVTETPTNPDDQDPNTPEPTEPELVDPNNPEDPVPTEEAENPDEDPNITPINLQPDGDNGNNRRGFLGFLLGILQLILAFFAALFGR